MSAIDSAVEVRLKADPTVATIVGARVYFDALPLEGRQFPAIRISKVSDLPDPKVPGDRFARIQVSAYDNPPTVNGGRSPAIVEALAAAIEALFHKPQLGSEPAAWSSFGGAVYSVVKSRAEPGPRLTEPGSGYYQIPVDVLIEFRT